MDRHRPSPVQSRWFLLLASPESAKSIWCCKEIEWWLEQRGSSTMPIAVTGGEVVWDIAKGDFDWTRTTALSPALRPVQGRTVLR